MMESQIELLVAVPPIVALLSWIPYWVAIRRRRERDAHGIDLMASREFEVYLSSLLSGLGYLVLRASYYDSGGDLILHRDGARTLVGIRHRRGAVGPRDVEELAAARDQGGCQEAMVVTSGRFTRQAAAVARAKRVVLWDRRSLLDAIRRVREVGASAAPALPWRVATDPLALPLGWTTPAAMPGQPLPAESVGTFTAVPQAAEEASEDGPEPRRDRGTLLEPLAGIPVSGEPALGR